MRRGRPSSAVRRALGRGGVGLGRGDMTSATAGGGEAVLLLEEREEGRRDLLANTIPPKHTC